MFQDKGFSIEERQALDGLLQRLRHLLLRQQTLRRLLLRDMDIQRLIDIDILLSHSRSLDPQPIIALVGGDSIQPRRKLGVCTKRRQRFKRSKKRFLRQILRFSTIAHHPIGKIDDLSRMPVNQLSERLMVLLEATGNQLGVLYSDRLIRRHSFTPVNRVWCHQTVCLCLLVSLDVSR